MAEGTKAPKPEGLYRGKIVTEALVVPDGDKSAYFEVTFNVVALIDKISGKEVSIDAPYKRSAKLYISEGTMEYLPNQLAAMGFHGSLKQLDPNEKDHISVIGNVCTFLCKHEKRTQGPAVGKIDERYSPFYQKFTPTESTVGAGKRLDALFKDRFKPAPVEKPAAAPKPKSEPKPEQPAAGDNDSGDDEVPF